MTKQQFDALVRVCGIHESCQKAAYAVLVQGMEETQDDPISAAINQMRQADATIRGAYVIHGPMEFRITVGHRDTHRMPGAIQLQVGDTVRLVAQSTERWVPIQVTALPLSPADYYQGVITQQLVATSRYQVGNGVRFSEDQVMIEEPRASSRTSLRKRMAYR